MRTVLTVLLHGDFSLRALDHLDEDVHGHAGHEAEDQRRRCAVQDGLVGGQPGLDQLQKDGDGAADDGQTEGDADAVALDVLGGHRSDLGAHGRAWQHDHGGDKFRTSLQV